LVVEVAPLEGGSPHSVPVGLHYDSVSGKPSFFVPNQEDPILPYVAIRPFSGEPFSQKCGTGCSNVVVHVTEPAVAGEEGKVVRGATVKLTASQVAPSGAAYPYPSFLSLGLRPFTGQVCAVKGVGEGGCGASAEATTDERGNAYFRYWAPGVVSSGTVLLTGTARDKSSACACGSRSGTNTADLDLSPDVVFVRDAPLSKQVVDYFTAWYGHKLIFDDVSWATGVITTVFPELKVADQIGKIASSSQGPDIVAALVLFALFHLSPDGLVITDLRDSSAFARFFRERVPNWLRVHDEGLRRLHAPRPAQPGPSQRGDAADTYRAIVLRLGRLPPRVLNAVREPPDHKQLHIVQPHSR
jgi:hypothetical protein